MQNKIEVQRVKPSVLIKYAFNPYTGIQRYTDVSYTWKKCRQQYYVAETLVPSEAYYIFFSEKNIKFKC